MGRIVRQIYPEECGREAAAERRLSAYLAQASIVLLGDPGAGKSHTFRELAGACGGRYLSTRAFLTLPVRSTGEVLFIDGLDERRGGRGDRNTVDALAAKLIEADPPMVHTLLSLRGLAGRERPAVSTPGLPAHLPDHAERLIDADPYGVLTYGANRCVPILFARLAGCREPIRGFGRATTKRQLLRGPGTRGHGRGIPVGTRSADAGFGIRGIVVEAAALGAPLHKAIHAEVRSGHVRKSGWYPRRSEEPRRHLV